MQTTGIFTVHKYVIPFDNYNEPYYIIPFGDIHRSSPLCATDAWLDFCEWAEKKDRCYFLGMGDYDDMASASERAILGRRELHEATKSTLEDTYRSLTDRFAKEVGFMRGKTIGLIEGNHYGEFQNATTTTQLLAEKLECKYLGVVSFIRIVLHHTVRDKSMSVDFWVHHGLGAGNTMGASIAKVEQMAKSSDAQIVLMGHDHQKAVALDERLTLSEGGGAMRLKHQKRVYIRTGSFLKGYEDGMVSYVADRGLKPSDIGVVKIELTPKRKERRGVDECYIDIHASV